MNIIYYHPLFNAQEWLAGIKQRLPQAEIREWQRGDERPADYALVWRPPHEMLANRRDLKAVFALGAGVDAILDQERKHPGTLPAGVPLLRLEDTGMAQQMQEYALSYVLRYFRRFDEYQALQQRQEWQPLDPHSLDDFTIGILGAGVLGQSVARKLTEFGFSVRCWSRSAKQIDGVQSFAGEAQRAAFLDGVKLVINLARGAHLVEADLLAALEQGQLAAATLDVFVREPLPQDHPFWRHPRVTITPHIAAITLPQQAMDQIAANIRALEAGHAPAGVVDRQRGY
jgi:glyoxylate/hydroxypyruvate reductase A